MLTHTSNVRVLSNSDQGSILWQRVPPFDQKELSKQVMNEEFKLSAERGQPVSNGLSLASDHELFA